MKRSLSLIPLLSSLLILSCSLHKVETSKSLYEQARVAEEQGHDLEAVLYWKALVKQTTREIDAGHFPASNHFLRASAYFELGLWEKGFDDLKFVQPESLTENEFWIDPLYAVMMGDYYSQKGMTSVAENFYESVLKKSALKSSSIHLLALERHVNNSIKAIETQAAKSPDPVKFKLKEYERLSNDVQKYIEDYPSSSVSHFLLADLLLKMDRTDESMEHLLVSLEMGLPTLDLQRSAEFELASLLSDHEIAAPLKSALLGRAVQWWGNEKNGSILKAGENSIEWLSQQTNVDTTETHSRIRYLAITREGKLRILAWEKL